jgi:hypothetical protein
MLCSIAAKGDEMKLWLLCPVVELDKNDNPWEPWYDKAFGFIVRAETEDEARELAHSSAGDENDGEFLSVKIANTDQPWKDAKYSTCTELLPDGEAGVVMQDFHAA